MKPTFNYRVFHLEKTFITIAGADTAPWGGEFVHYVATLPVDQVERDKKNYSTFGKLFRVKQKSIKLYFADAGKPTYSVAIH